jgi:hypothetical protein
MLEGLERAWFRVLGRALYRRAVLIERRLDALAAPAPGSGAPFAVDRLTPAGIGAYVAFRAESDPADVERRLARGHICFVVRLDGRIVSAAWVVPRRAWIPYLGCSLELAAGEVYLYDSFTAPEFRGRHLPAVRAGYEGQWLRAAGYDRLLAIVVPENRPALRHAATAGWRRIGILGRIELGPWRRELRWIDAGARPPGPVRRGPAADDLA